MASTTQTELPIGRLELFSNGVFAIATSASRRGPCTGSFAAGGAIGDGAPKWAIVDSNHGPPPYQSGALTN
jgi:hypothetical protein